MSEQLPQDLQTAILVRLPVKSLLRFQCVSKSWKSLIRSTDFISMHTNHNESPNNYAHLVKGCLNRIHNEKETDIGGILHRFDDSFREFQKIKFPSQTGYKFFEEVLDCGRELILLTNTYTCKRGSFELFFLWNPAARMTMTLPTPCIDVPNITEYCAHGFGFDHTSNDYKVLRIVYGDMVVYGVELFKLRTGAWESVTLNLIDNIRIPERSSQAFVNGATHWVGVGGHSRRDGYLVVLLFDMSDEEFRVMKLPDVITIREFHSISLRVSGGLLSVMHYNGEHGNGNHNGCCNWLMKEYGVTESWTKQYTVDLRYRGGLWEAISFRNKRILLLIVSQRKQLVLYDPMVNRFINLGITSMGCMGIVINTYKESLLLLNQVNAMPDQYQTSSREMMQLAK